MSITNGSFLWMLILHTARTPSGTCCCWGWLWAAWGNLVLAFVTEWDEGQRRSVMLNKSLCLLSDGSHHFTVWVTKFPAAHKQCVAAHGERHAGLCQATTHSHWHSHTCTDQPLLFYMLHSQAVSCTSTHTFRYIPSKGGGHTVTTHMLSTALLVRWLHLCVHTHGLLHVLW